MRNLKNIRYVHADFGQQPAPLTATAWDPVHHSIICAFGPTEQSPAVTLKKYESSQTSRGTIVAQWDAPCPDPDLKCDRILSLHCLAGIASICLIFAGGDIVTVSQSPTGDSHTVEIVGTIEEGITAAAWAPDLDSLAISTHANKLLFMTREFDPLTTVTLSPDDINVSAHVSVGWGKKETQFKGKRAKALHDPTVKDVDAGVLSQHDDRLTTLSWRGDGEYVVLNTIQDDKTRILRVFTREGELNSVSEPVDGLESAISWRPVGNLIAGIQRLHDRVDVVFFERNGLRHGQFALRLSQEELEAGLRNVHLAWNADSTILAVSLHDRVQLWTMSNYHYHLKQEILLSLSSNPTPSTIAWHPEMPMQLVLSDAASFQSLSYIFCVPNTSTLMPFDTGLVPIIDGRLLKLTPLKIANIPPPMSLLEIELPHNALDVAIDRESSKLAVLMHNTIHIYSISVNRMPCSQPHLLKSIALGPLIQKPRQVLFDECNNKSLVVLHDQAGLVCYSQTDDASEPFLHNRPIMTLCRHNGRLSVGFEESTDSPRVYELHVSNGFPNASHIGSLNSPCPWLETWTNPNSDQPEMLIFGLSSRGVLSIHKASTADCKSPALTKIMNVTSFLLTPAHLIITTTQHLLKFIHLPPSKSSSFDVPGDEPEKDERCRAIERGAKLVAVMPSDYKLVLQMPRGNLETIYPRALVLSSIRDNIKARQYRKAFLTCRAHRVDLNILHDFSPTQFMGDVGAFVSQLSSVTFIDLFLSSLKEEDVAQSMYKDTLDVSESEDIADVQIAASSAGTKINRVCDALLEVLGKQKDKHLQNLVTAHVCKSPPDLEAGLGLIAQLRLEQPDLVERAVEHICFLTDVNKLYDVALGLYDLDVALLVAEQSQKDPREYLPHLQRLKGLETGGPREFTIDNELRRYSKALTHLSRSDDFAQIKAYTVKNELYNDAMHLYRYQTPRLHEIIRVYAEFLSSRNRYSDAGQAFEYLGDYVAAMTAYRSAGLWREALSCAVLAGVPETALSELAKSMADGLMESKDFADAATISIDYLHDVDTAVRTLGKGYLFPEAMRVLALHGRADLLGTALDPSLTEAFGNTTETLSEMRAQLAAQIPRIRELRVKKRNDALAYFGDGRGRNDGVDADIPDNVSLASTTVTNRTGTTLATRYTSATDNTLSSSATRRTSKNRRREERKRARGKKGSVYEEEYLVNSVRRLIERLETVGGDEAERLVEGLLRRGMREQAVAVRKTVREIWSAVDACLDEVFGPSAPVRHPSGPGDDGEADGVVGSAMQVESQSQSESQIRPVVRQFKRFGLLDD